MKKSHNGCRLSKERFVKKNRIKKGDDFQKEEKTKYIFALNDIIDN